MHAAWHGTPHKCDTSWNAPATGLLSATTAAADNGEADYYNTQQRCTRSKLQGQGQQDSSAQQLSTQLSAAEPPAANSSSCCCNSGKSATARPRKQWKERQSRHSRRATTANSDTATVPATEAATAEATCVAKPKATATTAEPAVLLV